jgi:TonB-linked SusC/RagA family outer membrane protein
MKMNQLLTCLKNQVKFLLNGAFLIFLFSASSFAQEHKVTGTVVSADDNSPIPGVYVIIKGKTTGTSTDENGNFSLVVPSKETVLAFSSIGYTTQEIVVGENPVLNVTMASGATQLSEIVVTALGIAKEKKALTYSAQNVTADDVVQARDLNVANELTGKVAGLELIKSNSGVGAPTRVVLRGNRSIAGNNQPLYVVDGSPINNSASTPDTENGGVAMGDGIGNINPEDIESVTVLKGPSATALYGTRANNGAIVIVTKKGGARKGLGVEYSLNYSIETPVILVKMQNVYGQGSQGQYFKGSEFDWGPKMDGREVQHWTPNVNSPNYNTTYPFVAHPDNLKDYFQNGANLINSIALTAGRENIQGYFSFTNTSSNGIMQGNNLSRNNFNVRITGNLSKKLSFDTKLTYFHQDVNNRVSTGDDFANPMRAILRVPSNISLEQCKDFEYYDNNGFLLQNYWNPHSNGGENPYWMIHRIPLFDTRDRVLEVSSAKYEILDGLSLQVRTALDFIFDNSISKRFNDTYTIADRGKYDTGNSNSREINNDFLLNYNKTIANNFSLNVSVGGNMLIDKYYYTNTDNGDLLKPNLFTVSNASNLTSTEGGATKKLNSLYGFATLGFKNYVFLDVTARNDWSSTLPKTSWSYFYPSVGLTWVVSDMLQSLPGWLTFAKLRASLAQVGNDTDPYQLAPTFNFTTGGALGFADRNPTLPAADLKPEITTSKEFGIDIRFFQNRVGLDFTYYKSNSKNQLLNVPTPVASGYSNKFINAGNIQNSGYEGTLNFKPLVGDLKWDMAINFSHNKSLVKSLSKGLTEYTIRGRSWMTTVKVVEGHEFGDIYTRGFIRNAAGKIIVNGTSGLPLLTAGQTVAMGNYNPDFLAGWRNSFTYKAFDFSFLIDARFGGDVFSFTEANLASDGFSDYTLKGRDGFIVDGVVQTLDAQGKVTSESPNTKSVTSEAYWQPLGGRNTPVGECFKYDGTNVRVREAVLGYTKTLTNFAIRSFRFSLYGQNLFFIVNKAERLDPNLMVGNTNIQGTEGFGMPGTRTIGMNLRITF